MSIASSREQIAQTAAALIVEQQIDDWQFARRKAARQLGFDERAPLRQPCAGRLKRAQHTWQGNCCAAGTNPRPQNRKSASLTRSPHRRWRAASAARRTVLHSKLFARAAIT